MSSNTARSESGEPARGVAPEERAAQEYLLYFEQRSNEAAAPRVGIDARSRAVFEDTP